MNDKKVEGIHFFELQGLIDSAKAGNTAEIAGNIRHASPQEQLSALDLSDDGADIRKKEQIYPEMLKKMLFEEESCRPDSDIMTEIFDGVSAATDEYISPNITHRPIDMDAPDEMGIVERLAKELIPKPLMGKSRLIAQTERVVAKNSQEKAISDLAELVPQILKLMVFGKQVFLFESPIWKPVTMEDLILKLRETMPGDTIMPFWGERAYRELFSKLLTTPELQVKESEIDEKAIQLIPCKDGVYDMETSEIREALTTDFLFSYIDVSVYEIGEGAGQTFERFVKNMSGADPNVRKLLLEVIGVIISQYYPKVFFLLLGPKNTGKSQFSSFCEKLVGKDFCVSVEGLNSFSDRWTPGELFGKKLCVGHDIPKTLVEGQALATVKELVGRDMIRGERKYRNPFYFINDATLMFASNHRLRITGANEEDAFLDRVITVPFIHSVPRDQWIPNLGDSLFQERGYIVAQALQALRALKTRNFIFTKVDVDFYEDEPQSYDPISDFVSQHCELGDGFEAESETLHREYSAFCEERGVPSQECAIFARILAVRFPGLTRVRNANRSGKRGFKGIRLQSDNVVSAGD